jgi:RimJ/RimL family protein N-acetyltransferase
MDFDSTSSRISFRNLTPNDAEQFAVLLRALDEGTQFMLLEPGERKQSRPEDLAVRIEHDIRDGALIGAFAGGRLIGYVSGDRGFARRIRHVLYLVVGVMPGFQGKGVGQGLLAAIESWARDNAIQRLELTVVCDNQPAFALYRRCEFAQEGVRRRSMLVDGEFLDEYYMGKIL